MRLIDEEDIKHLALGAALLSGGGGGSTYATLHQSLEAVRRHGSIKLLNIDELDDDALVISLCGMGAPTVAIEHLFAKDTHANALHFLEEHLGRKADAIMSLEVGGANALTPLPVAASEGLPVVDADAMGRALPELQMTSFSVYGLSAAPMALHDDNGNRCIIDTVNNYWVEQFARSITTDMGARAATALYPLSGKQIKQAAIRDTISQAMAIGKAMQTSHLKQQPIRLLQEILHGHVLFEGKVLDIQRYSDVGFARGSASISGVGPYQGQTLELKFQNEYLLTQIDSKICATVPDTIGIFDQRSGSAISVEELRYGFRVTVLVIPAPPVWRTPEGLALVGPRAFGYDMEYVPFEQQES